MKKLGLIGVLVLAAVVVLAIVTAGQMGETNRAYAKGRIVLAPELESAAQNATTLFIIASNPDSPMPLGAFRKSLTPPLSGEIYEFVLTKDNMQLMPGAAGGELPAQFKLKARLDQDGVAGPDQPGDLVGELALVQNGQGDLEVRIDRLIE